MTHSVINSDRLDLVTLGPDTLRAVLADDADAAGALLDTEVPADWPSIVPAAIRLLQLEADPAHEPWLTRAVVDRDERRAIGVAGFHSPPDGRACVEIGYEILPENRRRGYAREAALALAGWAHATGEAKILRACVAPDNTPSLTMVASLGFAEVGAQIDDEDGPELIFERALPLA
ncbi:GNAT family N-acetyltransferase [Spirillospora sp. CA-294931]|uniref:GNAT family N-acetyltransferase n=1 Tax=Spirillospora sp. CA-294931 TaxID=3240042 RepID=UPI003D932B3A